MKKASLAAVVVLAVFAAMEIGARLFFPDLASAPLYMRFTNPHRQQSGFIPDDDLFWRLSPGNKEWEVNEDGYRGPAVPKEKTPGEFRVVCLGDSCTFGLGLPAVAYAQTYAARLRENLAAEHPDKIFNVLNFGCPGYTSFQGLRLLKIKAGAYHPDIVIAYFGINDGFDAVGYTDKDQRPAASAPAAQSVLRRSAFYSLLARGIVEARRRAGSGGPPLERVGIDDYHANLSEIADYTASIGAKAYFIAPPYVETSGELREETHRRHEPFFDIMPALTRAVAEGKAVIFPPPDSVHPTPEGHAVIARVIADRFNQDYFNK